MADELDADYEVHWTGDIDFYITRTDRVSGEKENLVFARDALNFSLEFRASDFRLSSKTEYSAGWNFSTEEFGARENPQDDEVDWYIDGEPVNYQDGKPLIPNDKFSISIVHTTPHITRHNELRGNIKSYRTGRFSQLGDTKDEVSEGRINISQASNPAPARLVITYGEPSIELQLNPSEFAKVVEGLSAGRQFWISLSNFLFRPLLVTKDGHKSLENFYWVPYADPFKEIYDRLKKNTGDANERLPEAKFGFVEQDIPEQSDEPVVETDIPKEDETAALTQQTLDSLNQQQQMLASLRRSAGFGNFLLFLILIAVATFVFW